MPTAEGKQVAADLVARELKDSGVEEGLREAYPAFLALNEKFKELCGDWQLFPGDGDNRAPNDHSDAAYDAGVIARLVELDRNAQGVCVAFTDQLTATSRYAPRLDHGDREGEGRRPEAVHRRDVRVRTTTCGWSCTKTSC